MLKGWLILGIITAFFGFLIGLFPKTLPRAAVRRAIAQEKNKGKPQEAEEAASFSGKGIKASLPGHQNLRRLSDFTFHFISLFFSHLSFLILQI